MSKVLTVRLDDELYNQLKSQSMPLRELVTNALSEYLSKLKSKSEINVYTLYTGASKEIFKDKYQTTKREVDRFLEQLEGKK